MKKPDIGEWAAIGEIAGISLPHGWRTCRFTRSADNERNGCYIVVLAAG